MTFENILEEIGGFGPFQITFMVLLFVPRMVLPCHFLLNNFIAASPPHRCDISTLGGGGLFRNLTREQRLTVGLPVREDGAPKSCEMFTEPQFQLLANSSDAGNLSTVQCRSGWVYDNSTFTSTIATEVRLFVFTLCVTNISILNLLPTRTCRYGRKNTLLASYVMSIVFGFASAFANSYIVFAVLRFLTGFGLTGIIANVVVIGELTKLMVGSLSWSVGNMLLAGLAYLINDWRTLTMVVTAPLGFAVLTWWIPESARWLLAHGKVEKAQFYLEKCAKFNKRPKVSSNVLLETLSDTEKQDKSYTYLHLIKTPKMRRLTLLTGIVFGVALTYYAISLNIGGFGLNIYLTHFIYAAIEVPAKLVIYFCLDIFGRKKCQAGTLLLTGISIVVNIFIPRDLWHVRVVVAVLGKGLSESAFTTVFLYTTELYPTVVRQNGMGYSNFMSRLGVTVAPLVLLLVDVWSVLPQIIICTVAIGSGLAALLLPETLNVRLPETIEDVEKTRSIKKKVYGHNNINTCTIKPSECFRIAFFK
uniref:Major facilitator superfamily (MFS) profile domain-containing protein n=1 Tax=Cyclopterus lumpus TaxID=8103 RepID=A0A8C2XB11_CYCLU